MQALIFAAGLGERMRPLTNHTPKPLLAVGGKPLIAWHLEKLSAIGVTDVVINTSWLAAQFPAALGDGARWGLRLHYSFEGETPLETGGGMAQALTLLRGDSYQAGLRAGDTASDATTADPSSANAPFIAINGDIWCDYDLARLPREPAGDAHLVLVDNPSQHPAGDFAIAEDGTARDHGDNRLTFSGIGVYRPSLLDDWRSVIGNATEVELSPPRFPLAPLLRAAMSKCRVSAEHHRGRWTDVGTPQRLAELNTSLD